jgi:hypothetical protein
MVSESLEYSKELYVMNVIIPFSFIKCLGMESNSYMFFLYCLSELEWLPWQMLRHLLGERRTGQVRLAEGWVREYNVNE